MPVGVEQKLRTRPSALRLNPLDRRTGCQVERRPGMAQPVWCEPSTLPECLMNHRPPHTTAEVVVVDLSPRRRLERRCILRRDVRQSATEDAAEPGRERHIVGLATRLLPVDGGGPRVQVDVPPTERNSLTDSATRLGQEEYEGEVGGRSDLRDTEKNRANRNRPTGSWNLAPSTTATACCQSPSSVIGRDPTSGRHRFGTTIFTATRRVGLSRVIPDRGGCYDRHGKHGLCPRRATLGGGAAAPGGPCRGSRSGEPGPQLAPAY